jgi:GNAT superfamily N-acetyltransferase
MEITPLGQVSSWQDQYRQLLNQGFNVSVGGNFFDDFPIYTSERLFLLGLMDADRGQNVQRLVSCCGIFKGVLKGPKPRSIQLIGGVVTHPDYQRQGFATKLIHQALEAHKQDPDLITVLWAQPGFQEKWYQTLGFRPAGKQVRIPLQDLKLNFVFDSKHHQVKSGWDPALLGIMAKAPLGLIRSPSDVTWLSRHRHVLWVSMWTHEGEVLGYLAYERGIDMPFTVHEWGGDHAVVETLLVLLMRAEEGPQNDGVPCILANSTFIDTMQVNVEFEPHCYAFANFGNQDLKDFMEDEHFWFWGLDCV